jgi:hypothetical protein
MSPPNPSPLAGEGGARRAAVGGCGGVVETIIAAVQYDAAQTCGDPTPNPLPQGERAFEGSENV